MRTRRDWFMAGVLVLLAMAPIAAADITGKWTASFDTQIGKQEYTYDFVVKGSMARWTATRCRSASY